LAVGKRAVAMKGPLMGVSPAALGAVLDQFHRNFDDDGELGASVSVWWRGTEVLNEGQGWCERDHKRRWNAGTLVPVYSATKGPSSSTLLLALDEYGLDAETPVREVWTRFPVAEATFGEMLSHQCGLAALDRPADAGNTMTSLRRSRRRPRRGGRVKDTDIIREPSGRWSMSRCGGSPECRSVRFGTRGSQRHWDWNFGSGCPKANFRGWRSCIPGRARVGERDAAFYREFARDGALTFRAFRSPTGFRSVREMNDPKAWQAGFPAKGGVGTASALAKFYQVAIGALPGPFGEKVLTALRCRRIQGDDRVLMQPTAFSAGCQMDPLDGDGTKLRRLYGPETDSFGHPGAGGSHAFGDPENGLSFAYTMNQMELSVLPGAKSTAMTERLYGS
jgi:CubicO group peptidase (beta-lactamase class C family)